MTTSDQDIYVWTWLPGAPEPVVAGRVEESGGPLAFRYGGSYLDRPEAIALGPDLPLERGIQIPDLELDLHGSLNDALPDSWGKRVISHSLRMQDADPSTSQFMLLSGSDRFGAIDFQASATEYVPRSQSLPLEDLLAAADIVDKGGSLPAELDLALLHGTSVGGARPKAQFSDADGEWIAKFSSTDDREFPAVQAEAAALELARRSGIRTTESKIVTALGKQVLLVHRFDRGPSGTRHHAVSAATILRMNPDRSMMVRFGFYDILREVRDRSAHPEAVGPELFERIAFAIATGNTDDHLRNHAAFWDGKHLELTPAYDLAPQKRGGSESNQALFIEGKDRRSDLGLLLGAHGIYGLSKAEAAASIERIVGTIHDEWEDVADMVELAAKERETLRSRQILPESTMWSMPEDSPIVVAARTGEGGWKEGPRTQRWAVSSEVRGSSSPATGTGDVWVPAHTRRGRPVKGHWRRRR